MKQFNVRLPYPTIARINNLVDSYGSQSKVIIAAVEQLHTKEFAFMATKKFCILENIEYYGDDALVSDIDEFERFVQRKGYKTHRQYEPSQDDDWHLRQRLWNEFCASE